MLASILQDVRTPSDVVAAYQSRSGARKVKIDSLVVDIFDNIRDLCLLCVNGLFFSLLSASICLRLRSCWQYSLTI